MGSSRLAAFLVLALVGITSRSQPDDTRQEVQFQSVGVSLSGTLFFPDSAAPDAAIVLVHGAGPQERAESLARLFASDGFAVLTYDKRGVGRSNGEYEGQDNVSVENLRLLAADAAAALRVVEEHPRLIDVPAGIFGISQAGWIGPIAAQASPSTSFLAFWSGPVSTVSEGLRFEAMSATDPLSSEMLSDYADVISLNDTDPRTSLGQLAIPGLWLYGAQDTIVPVELSIERLEGLIREGHQYEYKIFSSQEHNFIFNDASDPHYQYLTDWIWSVAESGSTISEVP